MPLYSDKAPQGYMGDPRRGAAMGRADVGAHIEAGEIRRRRDNQADALGYFRASDVQWRDKREQERHGQRLADCLAATETALAHAESRLAAPLKITLRRLRLDSGGYDPEGAYFGHGAPLYRAADESGEYDSTFRAWSRDDAKVIVRQTLPLARFYR